MGAGVQGNIWVANVTTKSNPCVSDYQLGILHGLAVNDVSHWVGLWGGGGGRGGGGGGRGSGGGWKRVEAAVVRLIKAFPNTVVGSTLEPPLATCVAVAVALTQL